MERLPSYGELAMLTDMFEQQCTDNGVVWTDLEVKVEAYLDFCSQWIEGDDNPEVLLCGYGYEQNTSNRKEAA